MIDTRTRALVVACLLAVTSPALGHIIMEHPNGGEVVQVGSTLEVRWRILISHGTLQNWDVLYSTKGILGPWEPIEMDLPPGDGSVGSIHTYDWTVPDLVGQPVWVRVIMDNSDTDYEDISDGPITIVPACPADLDGNGAVDVDDLLGVLGAWGACDAPCPADIIPDGVVDVNDLLAVLGAWGACPSG